MTSADPQCMKILSAEPAGASGVLDVQAVISWFAHWGKQ
jgi:hypothetical protein